MPIESLLEKIAKSQEWQDKIEATDSDEQAIEVIKEAAQSLGETVTDAEILEFIKEQEDDELDDDDLRAAAGGLFRRHRNPFSGRRNFRDFVRRYVII